MKKVFLVCFEVFFILISVALLILTGIAIYSLSFFGTPLNISNITDKNLTISVYNSQGLEIKEDNLFNQKYINLDLLPNHTIEAFLSVEDKNFYNHNGINLTRMGKAFVNNLTSFSIKEGASTITQQLIKNTHLSSDKTLVRKFNEVKLALKLEKALTKNEILENYLNLIYFGNNCYGIEDASEYYFSKPATALTLNQSATLAGIIKSPNYYSLTKHPDRVISRRNIVLKEMEEDGKITTIDYINEKNKQLELSINTERKNKLNSYSQSAIDEATSILKMPERQIALGQYKIYTYQDLDKQNKLQKTIKNTEIDNDFAVIDIDSKTGGINSYLGSSNYKILDTRRQIGSIAKPILVYGPAINENLLTTASLILDEPLTIDNYSPQNVNGKYAGYVSTRYALSKSLNIPAVKTASYVGLNRIKNYAEKMNLPIDDKDMSYSLALGGLTYGYNLKDLTGAYTVFCNNGQYIKPSFINYITNKDGEIVYKNNTNNVNVFREDSAYLITDMLKTCAKSGTARKLGDLPYEVASKTGTVGNKKGNTDAYNISYTTEDIVGVWFGNMDNKLIKIAGGNQPTALTKNYFNNIYDNHKPQDFAKPSSIEEIEVDTTELENNHILVKANEYTPEKYRLKEIFSRFNSPDDNKTPMVLQKPILKGQIENNNAVLTFDAINSLKYNLYKTVNNKKTLVKTISGENGEIKITDKLIKNQKTEYYLESSSIFSNNNFTIISEKIVLLNNDITENFKEKWYI